MRGRIPLLRLPALVAVAVMALNDHVLKDAWPGWVTGKLSDFAGLLFFPLLLVSVWTLVRGPAHGRTRAVICAATTGVVFTAIQLSDAAGAVYAWALGAAQWGLFGGTLTRAVHTADPTDLIALPMLFFAVWLADR